MDGSSSTLQPVIAPSVILGFAPLVVVALESSRTHCFVLFSLFFFSLSSTTPPATLLSLVFFFLCLTRLALRPPRTIGTQIAHHNIYSLAHITRVVERDFQHVPSSQRRVPLGREAKGWRGEAIAVAGSRRAPLSIMSTPGPFVGVCVVAVFLQKVDWCTIYSFQHERRRISFTKKLFSIPFFFFCTTEHVTRARETHRRGSSPYGIILHSGGRVDAGQTARNPRAVRHSPTSCWGTDTARFTAAAPIPKEMRGPLTLPPNHINFREGGMGRAQDTSPPPPPLYSTAMCLSARIPAGQLC